MHELALAEDIVQTIREKVTPDLGKVISLTIRSGKFSGVVAESLEFGLRLAFQESDNPEINIQIHQEATCARCSCGHEYEMTDMFSACPKCQSWQRTMLSGTDLIIESVEIDDGD